MHQILPPSSSLSLISAKFSNHSLCFSHPTHGSGSQKRGIKKVAFNSHWCLRFQVFDGNSAMKQKKGRCFSLVCCSSKEEMRSHGLSKDIEQGKEVGDGAFSESEGLSDDSKLSVGVSEPNVHVHLGFSRMGLGDQAFFLLTFIACTTSIAFTSFVIAAIPTLYAMGRAAMSLSKLADTAREELPSTMAAIRLSGMEISDLTLELSDLSQEIADGVTRSTRVVKAAEAGIRKIGALARDQTMSMIQERASLPKVSLQPMVAGAAKKTSRAMGQAKKTFMNIISRGSDYEETVPESLDV
ncbi:uncharacterized protein LOC18438197 isoform X1 [Amborella trichopoda]|nr:uncharacterized protein LOC18438197 isoform X1 [Amborella trichopoda]|eukprot:XP_006848449.2 uncharacterized protein LOC18438197 isoform X1 [Amborella trichopoda]